MATIGDAGQGIGQAQGLQAAVEHLQLFGARGDTLLQFALGPLQGIHQLLPGLQQPGLGLQFFLTHDVDAVGQGEGQQQHLQRRAELQAVDREGVGRQ